MVASIFRNRYEQGKKQFADAFGVNIVETKHSLYSKDDIYNHQEWRLADLMNAFENPEINAILCNIGGNDTIRLLRYMTDKHFQIIADNPKIFLGMSDTTVNHLMCYKAGLGSFYSPCTMFGYAENGGIPNFMIENTKKVLFEKKAIGILPERNEYIIDRFDWSNDNKWRNQYDEFDKVFIKICKEYDCQNLPIVTNMDFGHTVPQLILPYGVLAEINPKNKTISILESAVS